MAAIDTGQLRPITERDIKLGEPLEFAVYDKTGLLLLKEGFVIHMQRQIDNLVQNGQWTGERTAQQGSAGGPRVSSASSAPQQEERATFDLLDLAKLRLKRLFDNYRATKSIPDFLGRVETLATTVQEACTHDADSALANLHLDYESSYAVVHHMQTAIICELVGKKLKVPEDARLQLISAALTHDFGLLDIQDQLDRQTDPLRPDQRQRINCHPADSEKILVSLGVRNAAWLDAVRHHHERIDGSGYPDKIKDDALRIPTRILAVADMYSAMVRDRPYRKALVSRAAMRQLMTGQGDKVDGRFIQIMIKELGVFPPGAIVRLVNGEVAVVWKRQENAANPIVYAFIRADGMPMLSPRRRETNKPDFAIDGMLPFSGFRGSIAVIRSLWDPQ